MDGNRCWDLSCAWRSISTVIFLLGEDSVCISSFSSSCRQYEALGGAGSKGSLSDALWQSAPPLISCMIYGILNTPLSFWHIFKALFIVISEYCVIFSVFYPLSVPVKPLQAHFSVLTNGLSLWTIIFISTWSKLGTSHNRKKTVFQHLHLSNIHNLYHFLHATICFSRKLGLLYDQSFWHFLLCNHKVSWPWKSVLH